MGVRQVGHVHEIADARAVRRRVVVAEHRQRRPARGRRERQGNQVLFRPVVLADEPVGIGAGRVEIPQDDRAQPVRALEVRQRPLDRQLRLAIRVDRPLRMRLVDRRRHRLAERRRRGRKHKARDAGLRHRLEHRVSVPPTLVR